MKLVRGVRVMVRSDVRVTVMVTESERACLGEDEHQRNLVSRFHNHPHTLILPLNSICFSEYPHRVKIA